MPSTIKASDFNKNTTDKLRGRWTGADMANVVKALAGETVLIETDNYTGHTIMGKLVRVQPGYHQSPRVVVVTEGGHPGGIAYPVWDCGNIVVLSESGAKWRALDLQREEHRVIGQAAYDRIMAKLGGEECKGHIRYVGLNPGEYMAKYDPYNPGGSAANRRTQYANVSV
jgi:hypothetical protein